MIYHKITIRRDRYKLHISLKTIRYIRDTLCTGLFFEGITPPCDIDVIVTDDEGISGINRERRGIYAATDVLSFPSLDWRDGKGSMDLGDFDPETGRLYLGDIAINIQRARAQSLEYGHSLRRECCFLAVHSLMHLLGYDHEDTESRRRMMRSREEAILHIMRLPRK